MQPANFAHHWCTVMVDGLTNLGLTQFFVGPGSRSTPFVSAIARNKKCKAHLGIDERSISYLALGYAKCARMPGVVVVTSGTAAANLYPAVVEAYLSEVPLLVITADRPYELRDCGANQTIWQANMFANHINQSFDLAPPSSVVNIRSSIAIFEQAVRSTMGFRKGPVHINLQFREPVANLPHGNEATWSPKTLNKTYLGYSQKPCGRDFDAPGLLRFLDSDRGLIVVGELLPSSLQDKILALSLATNWPVFADITSNLRLRRHDNILHYGDLAMLNEGIIAEKDFDRVLKFGARVVSKRLLSFIERMESLPMLALSESPSRIDQMGSFEHLQLVDISAVVDSIAKRLMDRVTRAKARDVFARVDKVKNIVASFLDKRLNNEASYISTLIEEIKAPANLFLSSGMPIRDADQFLDPTDISIHVYANRGASGIDGVLSSAVGISIAQEKPVVLVIGDVAFLHDTNGLMLLSEPKRQVLVIVINNNGGGIFHFLPIAEEKDVVTPYLDSPHNVSLASLCHAHHVAHQSVEEPQSFSKAVRHFFVDKRPLVIEVMIKRDINVALHQTVYQEIRNLA